MTKLAESLGFPLCNLSTVVDRPDGGPSALDGFRIAPSEAQEMIDDPDDILRDPCLKHMRTSYRPYTYDRQFYADAGCADLWEKQAPYGYKNGVVSVLHLGDGRHLVLGLDRPEPLPSTTEELIWKMADVQLAALFLQDKAFSLYSPAPETPSQPGSRAPAVLSDRQREVLQWASVGKTAWETGRILSISESAVNKILSRAAKTLDCNSKAQAIARAFAQGVL